MKDLIKEDFKYHRRKLVNTLEMKIQRVIEKIGLLEVRESSLEFVAFKPTVRMQDGSHYLGQWSSITNSQLGWGIMVYSDGAYSEGYRMNNGLYDKGMLIDAQGSYYIGEWNNSKRCRNGTQEWANGDKYIGNWEEDERSGEGYQKWSNGNTYRGSWDNHMMNGEGAY